jgi:hypothetical protein
MKSKLNQDPILNYPPQPDKPGQDSQIQGGGDRGYTNN